MGWDGMYSLKESYGPTAGPRRPWPFAWHPESFRSPARAGAAPRTSPPAVPQRPSRYIGGFVSSWQWKFHKGHEIQQKADGLHLTFSRSLFSKTRRSVGDASSFVISCLEDTHTHTTCFGAYLELPHLATISPVYHTTVRPPEAPQYGPES